MNSYSSSSHSSHSNHSNHSNSQSNLSQLAIKTAEVAGQRKAEYLLKAREIMHGDIVQGDDQKLLIATLGKVYRLLLAAQAASCAEHWFSKAAQAIGNNAMMASDYLKFAHNEVSKEDKIIFGPQTSRDIGLETIAASYLKKNNMALADLPYITTIDYACEQDGFPVVIARLETACKTPSSLDFSEINADDYSHSFRKLLIQEPKAEHEEYMTPNSSSFWQGQPQASSTKETTVNTPTP